MTVARGAAGGALAAAVCALAVAVRSSLKERRCLGADNQATVYWTALPVRLPVTLVELPKISLLPKL